MPEWGDALVPRRCSDRFSVLGRVRLVLRVHAGGPEARKRDRPGRVDHAADRQEARLWIIGVLAVAVVLLLTDRFVLRHGVNEEAAVPVPEQSIAVLPFVNMSDGQGERVLLRRHLRGTAEPAGEDSAAAGDRAHLVVLIQGQGRRDPGDRAARCTSRTCSRARCGRRATRCGSPRS